MAFATRPDVLLDETSRRRLSIALAFAGFAGLAFLGLVQLAKDGSFWIDEASVALSLLELSPGELFGELARKQSFPRFLLLAIHGLTQLFGYETLVVRALPQLFFLLAAGGAMRLLALRFRDEPLLIALGALLLATPPVFVAYGALLKPYTFDTFLALVPFLLRDELYERALVRGESTGRLLALCACIALSYPFVVALAARTGAWWLFRALRGEPRVSPRAVATVAGASLIFLACLWWTDLRHTLGASDILDRFWTRCVLGSPDAEPLVLFDRLAVSWWQGTTEFAKGRGLATPCVWALRASLVAGLVAAGLSVRGPRTAWGSRSLGCAALLLSVPVLSAVAGYPMCAGRLTLFAFPALIVLVLEGLALAARPLRRLPGGSWLAAGAGLLLVAGVVPGSLGAAAHLARAPAPTDLRPWLEPIRRDGSLPVLTNSCTMLQIMTLPDPLTVPVLLYDSQGRPPAELGAGREAWLLIIPSEHCAAGFWKLRGRAEMLEPQNEQGLDVRLFRVRFRHVRGSDPYARGTGTRGPGAEVDPRVQVPAPGQCEIGAMGA